ncbi:MAG: hypothetical protein ACP5U2_15795 [Bryobacteraceae bacterium]
MQLQFRSFARPDLLKTIHPKHLTSLLEPHRRFFEDRGFCLPAGAEQELDCLALAGILAQPDEETPSELVEALYVIESFSDDQHFDELLDMAEAAGLAVGDEETTVDLAVRLYLHDANLLERKLRGHVVFVELDWVPASTMPTCSSENCGSNSATGGGHLKVTGWLIQLPAWRWTISHGI